MKRGRWLQSSTCLVFCAQKQFPLLSGPSQVKLNRMSASLRNARSQISAVQGRLEGLNLLNMENVKAMVDRKVENISGVVNKLSSTCTTQCAVQNSPKCKPALIDISLDSIPSHISLLYWLSPLLVSWYQPCSWKASSSPQLFTIHVFSFHLNPITCFLLPYLCYFAIFPSISNPSFSFSPQMLFW